MAERKKALRANLSEIMVSVQSGPGSIVSVRLDANRPVRELFDVVETVLGREAASQNVTISRIHELADPPLRDASK